MKRALVLLAACGGSSDRPDAKPLDAIESTGSVTVMVTERGKPVSGLPVFFHGTDGETVFEAVTSLDGSSGYTLDDGFVTVLLPKSRYGIDQLSTFAGVADIKPGEILELNLEPLGPRAAELDVTVTGAGPILLYTTCAGEEPFGVAPGIATKLALECTGANVDLLAVRIDPDTNAPIETLYQPNVAVGTSVMMAGPFVPISNLTVSYNNPHGYTFIGTTQSMHGLNGRLFDSFIGGDPSSPDLILLVRPNAPATFVLASSGFPLPNEFDEQVHYTVDAQTNPINLSQRLAQYQNAELDVNKPPIIGKFDVHNRKLVWGVAMNGNVQANMVRARVRFYRDDIPQGTAWTWQIVARRDPMKTEIVFPKLPARLAFDLNPTDGDVDTTEELTNVLLPGAYNTARLNGFADLSTFASPTTTGALIVQRRFFPEPVNGSAQ